MTDEPSFNQPQPPALSDDEFRETLDLLSTVMASVSDRVDAQTNVLDRLNKTATEARQAAFAAKAQTDPQLYGQLIGEAIYGQIDANLVRIGTLTDNLSKTTHHMQGVLKKAEADKSATTRSIWQREQKLKQFKARLPWLGLGTAALFLAITLLLPRFLVSSEVGCGGLGGTWVTYTDGATACAFVHE